MEATQFTVSGVGIGDLAELVKQQVPEAASLEEGSVVILFAEKYYLRIRSRLMSAVVFHLVSEDVCRVTVVSGGGPKSKLGGLSWGKREVTWGAVSAHLGELAALVKNVCKERSWEVTPS